MEENKEHGNIYSSMQYFLGFDFPKNVKILDIGCNYGSLIYLLYKRGFTNVWGIDINKKAIRIGEKKYEDIKERISYYRGSKIPFDNESFDVVMMFDVIEHIPNIEKFLKKEVYRVLKKKGTFIFQTPNKPINIFWVYLDNRSLKVKWWKEHCSLQTYLSLKKLLKNSGFKDIKLEKYNILTRHNKEKVYRKMGFLGIGLLNLASKAPLILYPNLWGSSKK